MGSHKSHLSLHMPEPQQESVLLTPATLLRKTAAQLPGIGYEKSAEAEKSFASVRDMVNADVARWESIPGVGKVIANRIVVAVSGKGRGDR